MAPEGQKNWYVIHTLTGQEEKVRAALQKALDSGSAAGMISQVLVPMEKVSEVKGGKKKISERHVFPGYVLVEMALSDEAWYLIKTTPGVAGFVGARTKPVPLRPEEVKQILRATQEKMEKPTPKVSFDRGESVRVTEGPFNNLTGVVEELNPEKGKLKVMVPILGRATPIELEYWQVEKI
ncbi:MAG: transcription termination/antitermination protein NusG [Candidatus Omnitrophica bacterium CG11_big_fil_rev_8_21_14_0_20_64_10]|nr:MAG: transcription termination/antitermination protein NusG [Candidatus Omnitrophica bacterium CG11_big_fil_rev_8_21_14_0_20_64_10]